MWVSEQCQVSELLVLFHAGHKCQLVYVYTAGHGPAFSACPPLFVAATVCAWGLGMSSLAAGWLG